MCTLFVVFAAVEYTSLLIMYRCQSQANCQEAPNSIVSPEESVHVVAGYMDLVTGGVIVLSFILYFLP